VLLCALSVVPTAAASPTSTTDLGRARTLEASLDHAFSVRGTPLLAGTAPPLGVRPYSLVWPFSQALAASLDLARAEGGGSDEQARVSSMLGALQRYWSTSPPVAGYAELPVEPRGSRYYDDNSWLGLALLDAAGVLRQPALETKAQAALRFVESGWDTRTQVPCPGGVFFVETRSDTYRAATSTAPAAELAAELFRATRDRADLAFAERAYSWMQRCLRGANGLYADHIDTDGTVQPTDWSYNQGSMIAAGVQLWRATGRRRYLDDAVATAHRLLAFARTPPAREPIYLMAIMFDDLRQLDAASDVPGLRAAAQRYADGIWSHDRNPHSNLVAFKRRHFSLLLEQAAAVRLYADLALWPRS
jgi:hypothetical protein